MHVVMCVCVSNSNAIMKRGGKEIIDNQKLISVPNSLMCDAGTKMSLVYTEVKIIPGFEGGIIFSLYF